MFKSKTMWVSVLTALTGVVEAVNPFIPPEYYGVIVAVIGGVMGALRMVTTKPVAEK